MANRTGYLMGLLCLAMGCGVEDGRSGGGETETDGAPTPESDTNPDPSDPTADPTEDPSSDPTGDPTEDPTEDPSGSESGSSDSGEDAELRRLDITVEGLETLLGGFHYEGWAIIDGAPVSFGKFNIDASGVPTDLDGIAIPDARFDAGRDLTVATDFVITIETAGDVDITPGISHILAGSSDGETSELGVAHELAIGTDFADAAGRFILATPTDGPDTNETSGLWFFDLSVAPPVPGLDVPELAPGWVYEGWAVVDGVPLTTGRFEMGDVEDFAAPFSGPEGGPPVPGEDFLLDPPDGVVFPAELRGGTAVLTVEPEPDFSDAPFTLKPLLAPIDAAAADHQTFDLDNESGGLPTAFIELIE